MARTRGERIQDYYARQQVADESLIATAAYTAKIHLLKANGIPLPVVEILPNCTCLARSFPHVHNEGDARMESFRFKHARGPWISWVTVDPERKPQ